MMLSYTSSQRCKPSEFHKTCIPAEVRQKAEQIITSGVKGDNKPLTETQVAKLNVVAQDAIWTERVVQEKHGNESWDANWAFLREFDSQGRHRSARKLPSRLNMYSQSVPNTQAGQYGSRVNKEEGAKIISLESKLMTNHRKEKIDSQMACY